MLQEKEHFEIPITCRYGAAMLYIYPQTAKARLFEEDVPYPGEARYHLQEGNVYTYEFACDFGKTIQFAEESEIISFHASSRHPSEGTIRTGIYVGQLTLRAMDAAKGEEITKVTLEIRSIKTDYESDYRRMLDDIAEYYTDLILLQSSPVTQHLEIDDNSSSKTLYQRFSFLRSIIDSEAFSEAIHKIMANPVRKWEETTIEKNIVGVKRLTRNNIRQLVSGSDRIPLSSNLRQGLPPQLDSVPRNITVAYKRDTTDCQENQFVKFILRTFAIFCSDLKDKKKASDRLKAEANRTIEQLTSYLDNQFFRQISMPTHLNMNSPVLQRKEGYREVLQAWLMFDLAAKLNWEGGDNVYEAGKKNVATLYEYWLFFKLVELVGEFFDLDMVDKARLVHTDEDGINLDIKQGQMKMIHGQHKTHSRVLNVALYYNRTFGKVAEKDDPIHKAGSWTMKMRPDYTLSLWPGYIREAEAEHQELVVHIHFDAKYRLNKVILEDQDNGEDGGDILLNEKEQQEMGIYKRADLLKMHAYKDAIRRTSGAYVLYPGTENREIQGFHEIIPGLGAFSIRPGHWQDDSIYLRQFLAEVKAHLLDRTSEREKLSYYQYDIYREANRHMVMDNLPEPVNENRHFLPDETYVVLGFVKSDEQLAWIKKTGLYNFRTGTSMASVKLSRNLTSAKYLLLHRRGKSELFLRLSDDGPRVFRRSDLLRLGYPPAGNEDKKKDDIYVVFKLDFDQTEEVFEKYHWTMKKVTANTHRQSPVPEAILLSELMLKRD